MFNKWFVSRSIYDETVKEKRKVEHALRNEQQVVHAQERLTDKLVDALKDIVRYTNNNTPSYQMVKRIRDTAEEVLPDEENL